MSENFIYGLVAVFNGFKVFGVGLMKNQTVIGFVGGIFITLITAGFVLAKNPTYIPYILGYSSADGFQKLAARHENGTYQVSYHEFSKTHSKVRLLFWLAGVCIAAVLVILATKFW